MKIAPYLRNMMGAFVLTAVMGTGVASARTQPIGEKQYETDAPSDDVVNGILLRMRDRHVTDLKEGLDQQYIAVTTSGWLNARMDKMQHLPFDQRQHIAKAVQDENKDRKFLQKRVATTYSHPGHPNLENALREHFAEGWLKAAEDSQWIVYNPHFKTFNVIT